MTAATPNASFFTTHKVFPRFPGLHLRPAEDIAPISQMRKLRGWQINKNPSLFRLRGTNTTPCPGSVPWLHLPSTGHTDADAHLGVLLFSWDGDEASASGFLPVGLCHALSSRLSPLGLCSCSSLSQLCPSPPRVH